MNDDSRTQGNENSKYWMVREDSREEWAFFSVEEYIVSNKMKASERKPWSHTPGRGMVCSQNTEQKTHLIETKHHKANYKFCFKMKLMIFQKHFI